MLDIMKACLEANVKRLVFTSSAGTVNVEPNGKPFYDETCWSDIEFCRTVKMTGWVILFIYLIDQNLLANLLLDYFKKNSINFSFGIIYCVDVLCVQDSR